MTSKPQLDAHHRSPLPQFVRAKDPTISSSFIANELGEGDRGRGKGESRFLPATLLFAAAVLSATVLPATAFAQQRPEVGYVFPPGGRAGTTVDVLLGGYDFTPDTQFFVLDERVDLQVLGPPSEMLFLPPPHWFGPKALSKAFSVPREVPARFVLPEGIPAGVIRWQAANANGASTRGEFVVSRGPAEVLENEQHAGRPQELPPLPLTVSGRLKLKEEVDQYSFTVEQSGPVTCRLPSHHVGHPVHAVVKVYDSRGRYVAESADTEASGLVFTFAAGAGETYTLSLHDLDFRGDRSMVYRLSIEQAPSVLTTIPAMGQRGSTRRVTFFGDGLATGKPQLESVIREVAFPDLPGQDAFSYSLDTPYGTAAIVEFELSDIPEQAEGESEGGAAREIKETPFAVTGVLDEKTHEAEYVLRGVKGETYAMTADAKRFGSPLDLSLSVFDGDGKTVAENDDLPDTVDAALEFQAPEDGDYRILIRDLSGRAGEPTSVYRLSVTQPAAGFEIVVPEWAETIVGAEPVDVSETKSGAAQAGVLTITAIRRGGFDGSISLELTGLPSGITVADEITIPAGETQVDIAIPHDAIAASFAGLVKVRASAELEGGSEMTDEASVLVTPVFKPRAVVRPYYPDAGRAVHRGATYMAPVVLERLEGYEGEVLLQLAAKPDRVRQGISGSEKIVPAGVNQVDYPLFLPEWVQTDRTSRIVLNTVVEFSDGQDNIRHLVNRMDRRITMNVEGALLKLAADEREFSIQPGQTIDIPLEILRSAKFDGPVEIALRKDGPQLELFRAEPVIVPADQQESVFRIAAREGDWLPGEYELTIQATSHLGDTEARLMSETKIFIMLSD